MSDIRMIPVAHSSNVAAIGHDRNSETLRIEFHSGGTYDFAGVSYDLFREFQHSGSKGKFFHERIKGNYPATKVGG